MLDRLPGLSLTLNGAPVRVSGPLLERRSRALRKLSGLTRVKVGCNAGDCGACTVRVGAEPVCACLMTVGQVEDQSVETIQGLSDSEPVVARLPASLHVHRAAQCGVCTPAALTSAVALLGENLQTSETVIADALGGVLCRCTRYRAILEAVADAAAEAPALELQGSAVGQRLPRLDVAAKPSGADIFGADEWPADALTARARATLGDLEVYRPAHPGIVAVFCTTDTAGASLYGVIPACADQLVFAENVARHRGEAVALIVGEAEAVCAPDLSRFPVTCEPLPALTTIDAALNKDATRLQASWPENVPTRGRVARGDVDAAFASADVVVEGAFETGIVEHAYIAPEAGFARRVRDRKPWSKARSRARPRTDSVSR